MRPHCEPDPRTGRCVTCADEALEARVVALLPGPGAEVDIDGVLQEIALDLLEHPVAVGDRVLVHAGVALVRLERNRTE